MILIPDFFIAILDSKTDSHLIQELLSFFVFAAFFIQKPLHTYEAQMR